MSDPLSDNPSIDTTHWELFFSGSGGSSSTYQLKGPWSNSESYVINDFCTFGDNLYICKSDYTSEPLSDNPSIDTDHWELFFSGSGAYQLKDNAYDSETNPSQPDNITDIKQLTFFRDVGRDLKQTLVMSEERVYGLLMPSPSSEADIGKVPMLNNLGQIVWAFVPDEEFIDDTISSAVQNLESLYETIEHILDLSTLDAENTTFNVVLTANRNNAISFVGTSEQIATVAIEIEDDKPYNIQIVGACTLAITGIEWWGDAITDITNKSEINIMNGRAIGVLIDV